MIKRIICFFFHMDSHNEVSRHMRWGHGNVKSMIEIKYECSKCHEIWRGLEDYK